MSSQKLTVLKTHIKVILNPYESPYEIYQVLSIRRQCLRVITKASFKQTDVFTLYVSYFCRRANCKTKHDTCDSCKLGTTSNQLKQHFGTRSTAAWSPLVFVIEQLAGVPQTQFDFELPDRIRLCANRANKCFHCCLCLHSSLYLKQAELSCSFSATPCFIFAVRHIHSRHLPTPSRNLGLRLRLLGISVACFHQSFDLFVTGRCLSYMVFMPTSPHLLFLMKHHRAEQSSSLLSKPNRNVSLGIILSFVFASWAMVAKINQPTNHYQMTPSTTE